MEPFKRVLWLVIDGLGFEEARRYIQVRPNGPLARLAREGYLGPSTPSSPVCQTPSALVALFSGAQPAQSGVWGYRMPDPRRPRASMLGFYAPVEGLSTVWGELEERGQGYSVMNAAFRNDPVWSRGKSARFAYDGYRLWKKPTAIRTSSGRQRMDLLGVEMRLDLDATGVGITKGGRLRCQVPLDGTARLQVTPGKEARVFSLGGAGLLICPLTLPGVRGSSPPDGARDGFCDGDAFRFVRSWMDGHGVSTSSRSGGMDVSVAAEMGPTNASFSQKAELMLAAARDPQARLVIGYLPNVDELNHSYADLIEAEWPEGRGSVLLLRTLGLVDTLLDRLMSGAEPGTLLVLSSDHGTVPHRHELYLNELLARAGLVHRCKDGYDPARSVAYYHPADCGQIVAGGRRAADPLPAIRRALDLASRELHAPIGLQEAGPGDPYLAFAYPLADVEITGRAPKPGMPILRRKPGGNHLSPLTPTPWIQAVLGAWSPGRNLGAGECPTENVGLKSFVLRALDIASSGRS
ncbi:MAG TPA: alkaline phosphatase family protein [Spirochaetia bacterium]|nr:alkaline phosphatase family protein [Spirochaetia bacterium]